MFFISFKSACFSRFVLLLALITALALWGVSLTGVVQAQATGEQLSGAPLVVPVYPKGVQKNDGPTTVLDLKDSYIVMGDGAVISVADWVLGSLKKSEPGIDMGDYEARLFLGQVARALVGDDTAMVSRAPTLTDDPGAALGPKFAGLDWAQLANAMAHDPRVMQKGAPSEGGIISRSSGHGREQAGEMTLGRVILFEDVFVSRLEQIRSDMAPK